jgi:hypothetical protein
MQCVRNGEASSDKPKMTCPSKRSRLVEFYVAEHNRVLPHSAFRGQTPDEMYFRTSSSVVEDLSSRRSKARDARLEANRAEACDVCPTREAAA